MKHKIKIYNTLTRKKNILRPKKGNKINLFVCGPTIYDFSHIGHAKTYVIFDSFAKYLRFYGYDVFYLQNITNIDDKIIMRARERNVPVMDLANAFEKEYLKDMKALGVSAVNKYARATDYIKEIISQVQRLEKKGIAYKIEGDGIYFNIAKFKNYGKFAGRTISGAEDATSRIDYSVQKINRGDFCLWKFIQQEGEPSWPSPWGQGRPGWHIEDTAITEKFFGPQYDIHGGAIDLIFPHHEAEISQMESISGKHPLARYWMHGGFLTVNGQKMAKSLGNFITIQDFLKRFSKEQIRFLILKNLWSSPVDYSESAMIEVKVSLEKIENFLRRIQDIKSNNQANSKISKLLQKIKINFCKNIDDNFNTPKAFAVLFDFIKVVNKHENIDVKTAKEIYDFFVEINKIFGIINFVKTKPQKIPAIVKKLLSERQVARENKDWQKSDDLRDKIFKLGFAAEDTPSGIVLRKI